MEKSKQIICIPWNKNIPLIMYESMRGYNFEDEVKNGIAQLWQVENEAHIITRIEIEKDTNVITLVVCCFEGVNIVETSKQLIKQAKESGVHFLRYHTHRKGMIKWGEQLGFKIIECRENETVLIKNLIEVN